MLILDTDRVSLLEWAKGDDYRRLKERLGKVADRAIEVVGFDQKSAVEFQRLKAGRIRVGTMDLRIAAIALANDAILLSRNLADFARVPGLTVVDWSAD